jgi:hypothetical protein
MIITTANVPAKYFKKKSCGTPKRSVESDQAFVSDTDDIKQVQGPDSRTHVYTTERY